MIDTCMLLYNTDGSGLISSLYIISVLALSACSYLPPTTGGAVVMGDMLGIMAGGCSSRDRQVAHSAMVPFIHPRSKHTPTASRMLSRNPFRLSSTNMMYSVSSSPCGDGAGMVGAGAAGDATSAVSAVSDVSELERLRE